MKKAAFHIIFIFYIATGFAQRQFIRTNNNAEFGSSVRIISTPDLGWVLFSLDSLKMHKYSSCSQIEWSKKYLIPNQSANVNDNDVIKTKSGGYIILTRMLNDSLYTPVVTHLDSAGNILWSKTYEDSIYNHYPYSIIEDNAGNLIIYGDAFTANNGGSYNMVCMLDSGGNPKWAKLYEQGGTWGRSIATSDNGILVRTGNDFIKTDSAGNVQWTSSVISNSNNFLAPVEVSDGFIFTSCSSLTGNIGFHKIDKYGNLVNGKQKISNYAGIPTALRKNSCGNLALIFSSSVLGTYYSSIVEIDKDINIITQSTVNYYDAGITLNAQDLAFTDTNLVLMAGTTFPTNNMFFSRMDSLFNTGCDTTLSNMSLTLDSAIQSFINTAVTSHTFNVVDIIDSAISITDSQKTLCSVPLELGIGGDTILCEGRTSILKNISNDIYEYYLWSTGENSPEIVINAPGIYWVTTSYDCGMSMITDTINVESRPITIADLGPDLLKCKDVSVNLNGADCSSCTYLWNTGSTSESISTKGFGKYWLKINNNGCVSVDTVAIEFAKCECEFYVPNTVTPNNDGKNDVFKPGYYCDLEDYDLKIFNRWGEIVFETEDPEQAWDCTVLNIRVQEGIYVYKIEFSPLMSGEPYDRISKVGALGVVY